MCLGAKTTGLGLGKVLVWVKINIYSRLEFIVMVTNVKRVEAVE